MENKTSIMHSFKSKKTNTSFLLVFLVIILVAIGFGIGSGYLLAQKAPGLIQTSALQSPKDKNAVEKGKTYGTNDTTTFKDTVEGKLAEGGIDGEGQYHLVRSGGDSQIGAPKCIKRTPAV